MASFSRGYVFGFAFAVCVVCSVAVAGVSMSLRERQDVNKERDLRANILTALGLPEDGRELEGEEVDQLWHESVEQRFITAEGKTASDSLDQDGDGDLDDEDLELALDALGPDSTDTPALLGVYVRLDGDKPKAYAIPVDGVGLWGPLSGYLALDPSGDEVVGATFFAPKETPGLGAEIMETPFEGQWVGKDVKENDGSVTTIRVVKPGQQCDDPSGRCVDGVSGATITSRGVDAMVAQALEWYEPFLSGLPGA